MDFYKAEEKLLEKINQTDVEYVSTSDSYGRVLAEDLIAVENVPMFDRSPLDGYCFNFEDSLYATKENPAEFDIIEEVPCGSVASKIIGKNQAIKILTGAKMPEGANAVVKYEDIEVVGNKIKIFEKFSKNENVILAGEDVKCGTILAKKGDIVDTGIIGIAISQGIKKLNVYRIIKIGFISTGSELLEIDEKYIDGKIYNSNRYIFKAMLDNKNIEFKYYGIAQDDIKSLKDIYGRAVSECDIVISTGGVSVGDYDLVDKALVELGFDIFIDRIDMKPGMACCFASKENKLVFALSGNPMSSVTTFYTLCMPAIRKMIGYNEYQNKYFKVKLKNSFYKKIRGLRFLRANVQIENGEAFADLNLDQGNIVIKSLINCNAMVKIENSDEAVCGMTFDCMYI